MTVDVAAAVARDAAGHDNGAASQFTVQADLAAPSVSLSGPADLQGGAFTVAIDFSESVEGFEASEVTVGNGTAALSGSGASYAAVITPASSGPVTVDVAAGVARDAAGHDNGAASQYTVQADLAAPSVTLSGPADTQGGAFTVAIDFSEPVERLPGVRGDGGQRHRGSVGFGLQLYGGDHAGFERRGDGGRGRGRGP